ncbi:DsrE family protein [Marinovum sp.]|uniref:DsrE family protein n=1 Tax=Marinovum sp. TaxID=2024839 RepID=UPI002B278F9C|nr:DsrE family protein [Marinovum sp.]
MSRFLIHIHSGPATPNTATLGCTVALAAANEGHETVIFFAGDGVHLLSPDHGGTEGQGTGRISELLPALKEAGVRFYLSGKSAKARGYDDSLLQGHPAAFAMPPKLVALAAEAETVLCY